LRRRKDVFVNYIAYWPIILVATIFIVIGATLFYELRILRILNIGLTDYLKLDSDELLQLKKTRYSEQIRLLLFKLRRDLTFPSKAKRCDPQIVEEALEFADDPEICLRCDLFERQIRLSKHVKNNTSKREIVLTDLPVETVLRFDNLQDAETWHT
jgi:hypothetical protein